MWSPLRISTSSPKPRPEQSMLTRLLGWRGFQHSKDPVGNRATLRRLFVDVSTIVRHDAGTGIQRVVRSVCRELSNGAGDDLEIHPVAASRWRPYSVVVTDLLPSRGTPPKGLLSLGEGDAFVGLDLSAHLLPRHERRIAGWVANGARVGIVVYDLLPYQRPEWFSSRTAPQFRDWLDVVARTATVALPISQAVADDLAAYVAAKRDSSREKLKLSVIPLGGSIGQFDRAESEPDHPVIRAMENRAAILMVGTVEPRKGHDIALRAHRHAWNASPKAPLLILAGQPGWRTESLQVELRALTLENDGAIWLEDVNDHLLDRLYRACRGLLVASLGEGYCLPLREALAYGKPILARDLPVLKELDSPAITYFSSDEPHDLGARLLEFSSKQHPLYPSADDAGWSETVRAIVQAMRGERPGRSRNSL